MKIELIAAGGRGEGKSTALRIAREALILNGYTVSSIVEVTGTERIAVNDKPTTVKNAVS